MHSAHSTTVHALGFHRGHFPWSNCGLMHGMCILGTMCAVIKRQRIGCYTLGIVEVSWAVRGGLRECGNNFGSGYWGLLVPEAFHGVNWF